MLYTDSKLKNLAEWYLTKGKKSYERVVKSNLHNYEQRKVNYVKLLEAIQ